MNMQAPKMFCLVMILLTAMLMVNSQGFAQQTDTAGSSAAVQKEEEPLPGLAELVHKATKLDEQYADLQRRIRKVYDLEKAENQFASITEGLDKLKEKTQKLQTTDKPNYQDLAQLKSAFREKANDAGDLIESVSGHSKSSFSGKKHRSNITPHHDAGDSAYLGLCFRQYSGGLANLQPALGRDPGISVTGI